MQELHEAETCKRPAAHVLNVHNAEMLYSSARGELLAARACTRTLGGSNADRHRRVAVRHGTASSRRRQSVPLPRADILQHRQYPRSRCSHKAPMRQSCCMNLLSPPVPPPTKTAQGWLTTAEAGYPSYKYKQKGGTG